jgi:predicted ribosome quality control (RQC) complex YloA/Tae2 family protein
MKSELSALDIYYLRKEWDLLINAKIDKIYLDKNILVLQFHVPRIGRKILKIILPDFIFLTEYKKSYDHPNKLCMTLRKYLNNSRLRAIEQNNFERILEFIFETGQGKFILIIELFSKGNIILCKEDYSIITAYEFQKWSQRTIRGGLKYEYPEKKFNILKIDLKEFKKIIKTSNKESIVKTLAIDLGLGGAYAEEVCLLAGIDKDKKKVDENEIKIIYNKIQKILNKKISPRNYTKKDITPFELKQYENIEKQEFKTFNNALDKYLTNTIKKKETKKVESKHEKQRKKLERIIKQQQDRIQGLEKSADLNKKKAELIYKNYTTIQNILKNFEKAREKYSWKEIKKELEDHKIIKKMDEKEKTITIELKENKKYSY